MANICIQLVTWNGEKYIPHLFNSLREQKYKDWELFVLDNGSQDATVELVKQELATFTQPHTLIQKTHNTGFAPAHNELFSQTIARAPYVILLNQDMVLQPHYIERLFYFMESHADVGAVTGRLMKWAFPEKTNLIDSLGLKIFSNGRVIDLDGGKEWHHDDDIQAIEVFGVSGALPMYRSAALAEVEYNGEVFDADFFSYKEDVDLAWRLRLAGWHAFTVLDAVAYHDRSASGPASLSDFAASANRKNKSALSKFYSYRNHLLMLRKNYAGSGSWTGIVPMVWYELKKLLYLAIFDTQAVVQSLKDVVRLWPIMRQKRELIIRRKRISADDLNHWFA